MQENKIRAYLETLKKLRGIIERDYKNGGRFPSVRKLCKELGISDGTCQKALKRLQTETVIKSYPCKGLYVVPERERLKKIGFIIGEGEDSVFWEGRDIILSALTQVANSELFVHQINGSPIETIPDKITIYWLSGLIWFINSQKAIPIIKTIYERRMTPFVIVPVRAIFYNSHIYPDCPNVLCTDYSYMYSVNIEFLKKRGHKKIVYIGNFRFAESAGLPKYAQKAGMTFSKEYCLESKQEAAKRLPEMIKKQQITAVLSEGGEHLETTFKTLASLKQNKKPELLVRKHHHTNFLMKKYPEVKVIGIGVLDESRIGKIAAEMLIKHINHGLPIQSMKIKNYRIESPK